eukprot:1566845-Prymnesium_polylepis.1
MDAASAEPPPSDSQDRYAQRNIKRAWAPTQERAAVRHGGCRRNPPSRRSCELVIHLCNALSLS